MGAECSNRFLRKFQISMEERALQIGIFFIRFVKLNGTLVDD